MSAYTYMNLSTITIMDSSTTSLQAAYSYQTIQILYSLSQGGFLPGFSTQSFDFTLLDYFTFS